MSEVFATNDQSLPLEVYESVPQSPSLSPRIPQDAQSAGTLLGIPSYPPLLLFCFRQAPLWLPHIPDILDK